LYTVFCKTYSAFQCNLCKKNLMFTAISLIGSSNKTIGCVSTPHPSPTSLIISCHTLFSLVSPRPFPPCLLCLCYDNGKFKKKFSTYFEHERNNKGHKRFILKFHCVCHSVRFNPTLAFIGWWRPDSL
jgi:hypothetical protein